MQEEIAVEAIKHSLRALKKRHLLEEGAHSPAFSALSRPMLSQVVFLITNAIKYVLFAYLNESGVLHSFSLRLTMFLKYLKLDNFSKLLAIEFFNPSK